MMVFITSLRHPATARDYGKVVSLLARSVVSVVRQQGAPRFRVVVVANTDGPDLGPHVEWVRVAFEAPPVPTSYEGVRLDKGSKYAVGLLAARAHRPSHVMFFDADDFVSRRLARFVEGTPCGWFVDAGYVLKEGVPLVQRISRFHEVCGTSLVHRFDWMPAPDLPMDAAQPRVLEAFGPTYVAEMLGSHRFALERYAASGREMRPLPFPAAVYLIGTGENHSGKARTRPTGYLTRNLREEFGIEDAGTPLGAARELVRSAGRALARRLSAARP